MPIFEYLSAHPDEAALTRAAPGERPSGHARVNPEKSPHHDLRPHANIGSDEGKATDRQMSDTFLETPVLERLWAALDALLEAGEGTVDGSALELSIDSAIREVARAIVAAKAAALPEQHGPGRIVAAPAGS